MPSSRALLRYALLIVTLVLGPFGLRPAAAAPVTPEGGVAGSRLASHSIPGTSGMGMPGYDCAGNQAAALPIGDTQRLHPPPPYITNTDTDLGTGGPSSGWKVQLQYQPNPATVGVPLTNDTTSTGGWWASGRIGSITPLNVYQGAPNGSYWIGVDTNYAPAYGENMEGLRYDGATGNWYVGDWQSTQLAPLQPGPAGGTWALWLDCNHFLHVFMGTSANEFFEASAAATWWQGSWNASTGYHLSAQVSADSGNIQGSPPPVLTPIGNASFTSQYNGIPPWVTIHWGKSQGTYGPVTYGTESPYYGAVSPSLILPNCHCGDPINPNTGDFYRSFDDRLTLPGRGIPLQFTQTYDSILGRQNGPLGYGWTDNYNMYLTQDASGTVWVHEETGTAVSFTPPSGGSTYTPSAPWILASLVDTGPQGSCADTLTFTRDRTQDHYVFCKPTSSTSTGQLLSESDRNGYTTTLSYANGLLSQVTDPAGRSLTFNYSGSAISSINEVVNGQTVKTVGFGYNDGSGNLTDLTDVNGGHSYFTYDSNHQLVTMEDARQYALHGPLSTGPVVTNVYNSDGRVTQQTDAMGRPTSFSYATNADGTQTTTVTDPRNNVSKLVFQNNELISKTDGYGTAQQATWQYQYDPVTLGVSQVTDPNNHQWNYAYDAQGNLLTAAQPQVSGEATRRTTTYTYNSFNEPLTVTDPRNLTTTYTYDGSGNLTSVSRPAPSGSQPHLRTSATRSRTSVSAGHRGRTIPHRAVHLPRRHPVRRAAHASSTTDIPSLRTQDSRTTLQNGQYVATIYPGPINYQDGGGTWQPIDNTLVPSSTAGYAVQNKANSYTAKLPKDLSTGVRIETKPGWIQFALQGGHGTGIQSGASETYLLDGGGMISYTAGNDELKEDITLPNALAPASYTFSLSLSPQLTARQNAQGGIDIVDQRGTVQFSFAPPTVQDSGAGSTPTDAAALSLSRSGSGQVMTLAIDPAWLTDPARIFPVDLDPTVTLTPPQDCFISTGGSNSYQFCNSPKLSIGANGTQLGTNRSLLLFSGSDNLDSIPANASVQSADLSLQLAGWSTTSGSQTSTISAYQLTQAWTNGVTWTTTDGTTAWTTAGGSFDPRAAASNNQIPPANYTFIGTRYHWDLTGLVQAWVNGSAPNDGVILKEPDETVKNEPYFSSTRSSDSTTWPSLQVSYTLPGTPTPTPAPAAPQQLIINGGFESRTAPWVQSSAGGYPLVTTNRPHTGSYSAWLCGVASCTDQISQTVTLPSSVSNLTLSYWYYSDTSDAAGSPCTDHFYAQLKTTSGTVITTPQQACNTSVTNGWVQESFDITSALTPYAGQQVVLSFQGTTASGDISDFYVDDVSLIAVTSSPTATPTATPTTTPTPTPTNTAVPTSTSTAVPTATSTPAPTTAPTAGPSPSCAVTSPVPPSTTNQMVVLGYGDSSHPGDVTSVTDPNGNLSTITYDSSGNVTRVCDPLGNATTYGYDPAGRVTSAVSPKGNAAGGSPAPYTSQYAYNPFDELTSVTDPLAHQTQYGYDQNGNLTSVTDARTNPTSYSYDADNELTGVGQADGTALGYAYDGDGNLQSEADGLTQTTQYSYDPLNRVSSVTDPLQRQTSYSYDGNGNLLTLTDAMNRVTSFGYDAVNELISVSYSDGTTPNVSYGYDQDGERTSMSDGTGSSSYTYDILNRLTQSTDGAGNAVGYSYDLANNLTSLSYPGPVSVTRSYDGDNRLTGVTDWLQNTTHFNYDPNSNLTTEIYPNSITANYSYNAADQLTQIADTRNGSPVWTFGYTRDPLGQVQTATDPVAGTSHTYGYDNLNRLQTDQQPTGNLSWSYDAASQLKTTSNGVAGISTSSSYDAGGQLQSWSQTGATGQLANLSFSFNANGDRTQSTDSVSTTIRSYGYNQADELTSYTNGNTTASYAYNGDGLRVSKTVNGTAANQTWDLAEGLPTIIADGATKYITGPGGLPIEQVTGSTPQYYLQDQLGSTRGLTDSTGAIVATYSYDVYGAVTASSGTASTPFQYAGQYTDGESGLQYLRARYYDPATGQFLSVDPLVGTTQQPYSYTGDDPTNWADASGLCKAGPVNLPVGGSGECSDAAGSAAYNAVPVVHSGAQAVGLGAAACAVVTSESIVGGITCGGLAVAAGGVTVVTGAVLYVQGRQSGASTVADFAGADAGGLGYMSETGATAAADAADRAAAASQARLAAAAKTSWLRPVSKAGSWAAGQAWGVKSTLWGALETMLAGAGKGFDGIHAILDLYGLVCG